MPCCPTRAAFLPHAQRSWKGPGSLTRIKCWLKMNTCMRLNWEFDSCVWNESRADVSNAKLMPDLYCNYYLSAPVNSTGLNVYCVTLSVTLIMNLIITFSVLRSYVQ